MDAQFALANVHYFLELIMQPIFNKFILSHDQRVNVSALYDKIHDYINSRDPTVFRGYEEGGGGCYKVYWS